MDRKAVAGRISSGLGLDVPVIGLAFVDGAPAGVPQVTQAVPAACSFWRTAETSVFYAAAAQHFNGPIGAMTMGFELPEEVQQQVMGAVTMMCEAGYLSPDEPAKMPTTGRKAAGIVYGPLADLPIEPDLLLLWLTPRQAMFYSEAIGTSRWTTAEPATVWGRPACAALPSAMTTGRSSLSFGCAGMRTFTGVREDRLLAALPGQQAGALADALAAVKRANTTMVAYYEARKAAFTS
jgi:uncharacterized protein (DUF169 family)